MAIKYPELSKKLKNNRQAMEKACLDTNNEISENIDKRRKQQWKRKN